MDMVNRSDPWPRPAIAGGRIDTDREAALALRRCDLCSGRPDRYRSREGPRREEVRPVTALQSYDGGLCHYESLCH